MHRREDNKRERGRGRGRDRGRGRGNGREGVNQHNDLKRKHSGGKILKVFYRNCIFLPITF